MPVHDASEPRIQALKAMLDGQATRPGSRDLGIALGVGQGAACRYLRVLEARGVRIPPLVHPVIRCAVYPALQDGIPGWQASIKQPRVSFWMATCAQALAFKRAVGSGMAIDAALSSVQRVVICPRCEQAGFHERSGNGALCIEALKAALAAREASPP